MLSLYRHIGFIRALLIYTFTAFGGPQGHYGMMLKTFVHKRKDITEIELVDLMAFCNLLPGASSTQTITLIGYKRGGLSLAIITLLIWMLPASIIMGCLSFFVYYLNAKGILGLMHYIQPMAIGFLSFSAYRIVHTSVNNLITIIIAILAALATYLAYKSPWIFPILLISAGIATNFSNKRIPQQGEKPRKIKWGNLFIFFFLFATAGFLSEKAARNNWPNKKLYTVFETSYRFGSLVFGGGDVLMAYMYEQYVVRPSSPKIITNKREVIKIAPEEFLTGSGIVRAIPGPVFSIGAFTGGLALKGASCQKQTIGIILGTVGIFLPSALLALFFFPVWNNLKRYAVIYRSLEGINGAVSGIMVGATAYLAKDYLSISNSLSGFFNGNFDELIVLVGTFVALKFSKIPPPFIVLLCLLLGWLL